MCNVFYAFLDVILWIGLLILIQRSLDAAYDGKKDMTLQCSLIYDMIVWEELQRIVGLRYHWRGNNENAQLSNTKILFDNAENEYGGDSLRGELS